MDVTILHLKFLITLDHFYFLIYNLVEQVPRIIFQLSNLISKIPSIVTRCITVKICWKKKTTKNDVYQKNWKAPKPGRDSSVVQLTRPQIMSTHSFRVSQGMALAALPCKFCIRSVTSLRRSWILRGFPNKQVSIAEIPLSTRVKF